FCSTSKNLQSIDTSFVEAIDQHNTLFQLPVIIDLVPQNPKSTGRGLMIEGVDQCSLAIRKGNVEKSSESVSVERVIHQVVRF
ncbi:Protein of unknown function, partial [Gryllus bimaculatus]